MNEICVLKFVGIVFSHVIWISGLITAWLAKVYMAGY